jgi:phosphonate transport system substrate-binding protein
MTRWIALIALAMFGVLGRPGDTVAADDWRKAHPKITMGIITSENEADRVKRWAPIRQYLSKGLGVPVEERLAIDYAGVIEAMRAKKIELAYFGPASFSQAWIVTDGQVEPLVSRLNKDGSFGYHSVVVVKANSPYKTIEDLRGKKLAFADPNSTSGHQAPRYFLTEAGFDPDKFFGQTAFSGSHENSVIALLNGTFDAAATWWHSEQDNNFARMEEKKMIPPGQVRMIWKSPNLPDSPWSMPLWLPAEMRSDVRELVMRMPQDGKEAFQLLVSNNSAGFKRVTLEDYQPIIRMIKHNLEQRKKG